ncbi:MAG: hypothetical protein ACRDG4_11250 [Chloroflexota bacterium]
MSVQIPRPPNNIRTGDRLTTGSVERGAGSAESVIVGNSAAGSATRLSLSSTARLADAFNARQAAQRTESGLSRTHAVLETSYIALQRESRLYDGRA